MAVTQQVYFDAIGRAGLVFSDGVLENIGLEKAGCKPYWERLFEQFKQIECAEFFLEIEDYAVSDDSAYFYRAMLGIAGSQYSNATPDPNAQLPNTSITIVADGSQAINITYNETDLIDSGGGNWYLPLIDKGTGDPLPADYRPVLLTLNGASFTAIYDTNFNPTRLYGFPDNTGPQTIVVTFITTT